MSSRPAIDDDLSLSSPNLKPKKAAKSPGGYKEAPAAVTDVLHHPHTAQQGLPPPNHLVHRTGASPHPFAGQHHPPGPYASPHSSGHALPSQHQAPHQSPYSLSGPPSQPQDQVPYFQQAQPSPFSTNSAAGSYSSSGQYPSVGDDKQQLLDPQLRSDDEERRQGVGTNGVLTSDAETPELMATATMNRQYPAPIYHTPQSASPASVQSPQHDQHGRPLYAGQMYYPQPYQVQQQSPYSQHPGPQQPTPLSTNFMSQPPGPPHSYHTSHPVTPALTGSPGPKLPGQQLGRPGSGMGPVSRTPTGPPGSAQSMHQGPPSGNINANAAPGPIPASTPLVVRQDQNGVQWIAFEYSRDRVKMEYTIRCDVESVDVNTLSQEFKTENCVYPRACCGKDQYKGNRLHYETECNTVGWALAQLNPCLRGKRGLIQRAVDSWRNSNQDPRLRSRRVRRMAKISNRRQAQQAGPHMGGPAGLAAAGRPGPLPGLGLGSSQQLHHHHQTGGQPGEQDVSDSGSQDARHAHNFYPNYPPPGSASVVSNMPPSHDMEHGGSHVAGHAVATTGHKRHDVVDEEDEAEMTTALFGDLPEAKRRKFILVDDAQRGTRVRVRVMLDQVRMAEMPDSYRRNNSVYPRSWFATEMQDGGNVGPLGRWPDDVSDGERADEERVRTLVPLLMMDGSEAKVSMPRMSRLRRKKEVTLNDLGYRMSWSQSRVFSGRTLFLQRSLDAYRNKMRSTMVAAGHDVVSVAPHFETRVGKRKWLERAKKVAAAADASP